MAGDHEREPERGKMTVEEAGRMGAAKPVENSWGMRATSSSEKWAASVWELVEEGKEANRGCVRRRARRAPFSLRAQENSRV